MDSSYYLSLFLDEGRERLQQLAALLETLEKAPADLEMLNDMFRTVHTFKGMADTMDFRDMVALTHAMEGVLDALRRGRLELDPPLTRLMLRCLDALEGRVEAIDDPTRNPSQNSGPYRHADFATLETQLAAALARVHPASEARADVREATVAVPAVSTASGRTYRIDIVLDPACYMKSARALVITSSLETLGAVLDITPSLEELEWEEAGDAFTILLVTDAAVTTIEAAIAGLSEIASAKVQTQLGSPPDAEDRVCSPAARAERVYAEGRPEATVSIDPRQARRSRSLRVEADHLDGVMDLLGALSVGQNRLARLLERQGAAERPDLREALDDVNSMTGRLREALMRLRLVPLDMVFNRFARVVRDLSYDLGKQVALVTVGGEIPLDRLLVDELGEVLVHLVRNALDHGLETPVEREAAGKPGTCTLTLEARLEGAQALIRVADDGRGVDVERVKARAVEKGLLAAEEARTLPLPRLLEVLFMPGFSTSLEATRLSGRGVGLDAVKHKVDALGGFVHIETQPGRGTAFELRFPIPRDFLLRTADPLEARAQREG